MSPLSDRQACAAHGALEDLHVLRDGVERHVEALGEIGDARGALRQLLDDLSARRIRERREGEVETYIRARPCQAIGGDIVVNPAVSTYHPAMRCPSSHTENREGPQFPSDEEIVRARAGVTCDGGRGPKKRGYDAAYGC